MKNFKWGDDVREISPSEENKIVITSIDIVIERINRIHNFVTMFENLEYVDYYPDNIHDDNTYRWGDFKDFLESNFIGILRVNKWGMFPPLYHWAMQLGKLKIKINKEQMQALLSKNYDFYKNRISHSYGEFFEIETPLYYDLADDKFTSSI